MPRKLTTFKFSPEDLALIDLVQKHGLIGTRSEAVRHALRSYAERHGLMDKARAKVAKQRKVAP